MAVVMLKALNVSMGNVLLRFGSQPSHSGSGVWEGLCTVNCEEGNGHERTYSSVQSAWEKNRSSSKDPQAHGLLWLLWGVCVPPVSPGLWHWPWAEPHPCRGFVAPDSTGWAAVHPICVSGTFIWAKQQTHISASLCFTSSLKSVLKQTSLCCSLTHLPLCCFLLTPLFSLHKVQLLIFCFCSL